jgi:hypothetical protein
MFIREGLLDPLSSALLNVIATHGESSDEMTSKILHILLVFCQVSHSDVHVRTALGARKVVRRGLFLRASPETQTNEWSFRPVTGVRTVGARSFGGDAESGEASVDEPDVTRRFAERKCHRNCGSYPG